MDETKIDHAAMGAHDLFLRGRALALPARRDCPEGRECGPGVAKYLVVTISLNAEVV
jgi:hypothetical protein